MIPEKSLLTGWLDDVVCVDFVFNFIFLAPVRGKQVFLAQLPSFAKLEEFQ